ncbi:tRNA glutamyl-Q(34) synthetase GluQRS [Halopseudomonas nanhaiensis]|uniref:tRNA glutamyl-Q(34) synthetase GluQRS n=1 Tax=Halopseudomonas nanhaiensis TaxID=2830842 RepID=UPI001CBC2A7B|nr:tRNA glutamyl-Q(34) synthetase GluQRS [Halopseudomonas nanhaiensis]UAW97955.1 tRNA glutamyl-Q(34) synthetase GluQRS [Halopseudomonas nanhaiensis]
MHAQPYVGRFAPTPSGHLHFGSLVAALASYLDARHHHGSWLVRVEDLDQPRVVSGATDHILRTLECYGLEWDGDIVYQSQRIELYETVLAQWLANGKAYYCDCSRQQIAAYGGVYPGTCRTRGLTSAADRAVRVRVPNTVMGFVDRLQGPMEQALESEVGDIAVRRRDGVIAYQLAVVADDIHQGVTDVVRGADLLDSTPRQLWLYHLFQQPAPRYLHVPLIMRPDGEKLSKRLGSAPLEPSLAAATLWRALAALRQSPPARLRGAGVRELLAWAVKHWRVESIPPKPHLLESSV